MAIQTAEAKLYTGIRCWVVDKNISANLTSTFTTGNKNRPIESGDTVYPGILAYRLYRTTADLEMVATINRVDERYKTYGGGNNVITVNGVDNTRNWKVTSGLVCKFPTYIQIDIEKLGLPEGTDCIVDIEEGWITEGDYPGSTFAPNPEVKNFFTFRTPWYGAGRLNTAFTLPNTVLRIKQLAANFPQAFGSVTFKIRYNRGNLASLFVDNFRILPTAVKRVRGMADLFSRVDNGSENWNPLTGGLINYRTRYFDSVNNAMSFTVPNIPDGRIRLGVSPMTTPTTISANGDRTIGPITGAISSSVTMNINAVKITNIAELEPIVASMSLTPTKVTGILSQNLQATSSLSGEGSVPMVFTWTTETSNQRLALPVYFGSINAKVTWGDGSTTTETTAGPVPNYANGYTYSNTGIGHVYANPGTYTVTISGYIQNWGFTQASQWNDIRDWNSYDYHTRRMKVTSWGYIGIETLVAAHANLLYRPISDRSVPYRIPPTVKDISYMFQHTYSDTVAADWDRDYISNWDVSNVEKMERTFYRCKGNFNTNLGNWNVSKVQNFNGTFYLASRFTGQGLQNWNTSSATNMGYMFYQSAMNTSLNNWDVNQVTDFRYMFAYVNLYGTQFDTSAIPGSTGYTGTLWNWDLSSANRAALEGMLYWGNTPKIDLSSWCVPNVESLPDSFILIDNYNPDYSTIVQPNWGTCPNPRPIISSITSDKTSVVEGESVTFTINVSNWISGSLYYRVNGGYPTYEYPNNWGDYEAQTGQPNFQDIGAYTGYVAITNGVGTLTIPIPTDGKTEIGEYFRVDMLSAARYFTPTSTNPVWVAATPVITIQSNNT